MTNVLPHEFASDTPPERIMGAECEYSIHVRDLAQTHDGEQPFDPEHLTSWYLEKLFGEKALDTYFESAPNTELRHFVKTSRVNLRNGARAYVDIGQHPEYCTPETRAVGDVVAADLAGVRTMQGLAHSVRATPFTSDDLDWDTIIRRGDPMQHADRFEIYRRTGYRQLPKKPTNGYHDNYIVPSEVAHSALCVNLAGAHLASNIWGWAGAVGDEGYELSQKSTGVGGGIQFNLLNITIEGAKPLAAIHSDTEVVHSLLWQRLEGRSADAPLSPWANAMRFGTTSLVMRLAEHPHLVDERLHAFAVDDPVEMFKQANLDLTFRATTPTSHGEHSALNVQEMLAVASAQLAEQVQLPEHELWTIRQWLQACNDLRTLAGQQPDEADFSMLADRSEWAARHTFLRQKLGDTALTTKSAKSVMVDLLWDRIYPAGLGLAHWKKQSATTQDPFLQNILTRTDQLQWQAPENTRAAARSQLIGSHAVHDLKVEWHYVDGSPTAGGKLLRFWLDNPWDELVPSAGMYTPAS